MVVRGYFSVEVYKYARPGYFPNWIVFFKVTCGESYKIQRVIEALSADSQQAPILLSR